MSCVSNKTPTMEEVEQSMYVNDINILQEFHKKSLAPELRSPTPCPGSKSSSADGTYAANQTMAHLKDEIVNEIKREVCDPLIEMLTKILNEIQTLKERSETTTSFSNVSCQTEWPDSATFAVNNNDETVYDVPRTLKDRNDASISRGSNIDQSQSNPVTCTRMSPADDMENAAQIPALPPRKNPYPHSSPAVQGHAISNSYMFQSNSSLSRGNVVQVKPRPKSEVQPTRVHQADKRELLANALQFFIEDIVEGLAYQTDKLLDDLVVEGFLTRDECVSVKNIGDGKDHIRTLLSLMKRKDLQVLEGFMKHIRRYNKDVVQRITVNVECSMKRDAERSTCALCKIERQVNIKDIADSLWSVKAIDDNLYSQIIHPDSNSVEQSTLWKKVFHSFNSLTTKDFDSAKTKLLDYLSKNDISLEREINYILDKNQGKLLCICQQRFGGHNETVQLSSSSNATKVVSSDKTGGGNSNIALIPAMKCGKESNSSLTLKESKVSEDINKPTTALPTGQERSHSGISIKPPLLPKRPPFIRKPKDHPLSTVPTKCEVKRKLQSMPDAPVYDIPTARSTKASDKSKVQTSNSDDGTQGFSTEDKTNDPLEKDSQVTCGIPPLPVKKNKYPPWKKADEQGPSYV